MPEQIQPRQFSSCVQSIRQRGMASVPANALSHCSPSAGIGAILSFPIAAGDSSPSTTPGTIRMATKSFRRNVLSFEDVTSHVPAETRRPTDFGQGDGSVGAMACPYCAGTHWSHTKLPAGVTSLEQWLDLNA
jgi:hypothetical protein